MQTSLQLQLDICDHAIDRLQEVLTRRQIDRLLAPIERRVQIRIAALFRRQGTDVLKTLGSLRTRFSETLSDDFNKLFDSAIAHTSGEMLQVIERGINAAVLVGGKSLLADFRSDLVFSLTNPRAVVYTRSKAGEAIKHIDDTTRAEIRRLIVAGVQQGTSYSKVAQQIKARYTQYAVGVPQRHIRSRAELIAITEMGNAYQVGNFAAAHQITASGVQLQKYWNNKGDSRVSAGCLENTRAGWIDLDQAFPSGHDHPLRFPGCRCATQYRRKPRE